MGRVFYPQARAILQVIFDGYGDTSRDSDPVIIPILPKAVTIVRNSYKQADSYELTFDAGDLPVDPQLVRAGAAEIYLFQTGAIDDDQRLLSRRDPTAGGVSKTRFAFDNEPQIAGLFDRDDLELTNGGKWVTIAGQDYTAHLAALQWPPLPNGRARRIPVGKRIDKLFEELLEEATDDGRLRVAVRGVHVDDLPIVGAGEVRNNRRGIPVEQNTTYWEVMYKIATRYGLICYVDGLDVVLSAPKTITDTEESRATIKRLSWGTNVEQMRLTRELGKEQSPTIVARSYDPTTGETITVEYPEGEFHAASNRKAKTTSKNKYRHATKATTRKSKRGKVTTTVRHRDEYQIITLDGITDRAALRRAAEAQFNLLGQGERKVVASTRDLRDSRTGTTDEDLRHSDMLTLVAGDAVTIEWDEFNRELLADSKVPEAAKVEHLVDRGYNRAIATEIAKRYKLLEGVKRPMRVREVTYEWEVDDGISIEFELVDFIVLDGIRPGEGAERETRQERRARRKRAAA